MPKIGVEIQYDIPDDPMWLNPDNVCVALSAYCPNTKFHASWTPCGNPWGAAPSAESQTTAVQQLKAEIAALVTYLCNTLDSGDENKIVYAIAKLRQLSAV